MNHLVWARDSATDGGAATSLATYVYDVFGDRIEKDLWSSGTTTILRFAYDVGDSSPSAGDGLGSAGNLWADLNGSGSLLERYILGDSVDQLFARIFSTGTAAWYLTDRLGSVRDIIDNTGAVIDHLNYDGFGNVTSETQPWNGDRFKWTGRELDSETGLQYNRARYYDPKLGRWTSQDPVGFRAGDPNLYRYVTNDTPNATDPSGLYGPGLVGPVITDPAAYTAAMQQAQQAENQHYIKRVNYYLKKTREGRAALRYLNQHPEIKVEFVHHIGQPYKNTNTGAWEPGRNWGLTEHPNNGIIRVHIAMNLDGHVSPANAAATFIHEMTHARIYVQQGHQNEFLPRLNEAIYYAELLNQGFVGIDQVPRPYNNFLYRGQTPGLIGTYYGNGQAVQACTNRPPGDWSEDGNVEFGQLPGVPFNP